MRANSLTIALMAGLTAVAVVPMGAQVTDLQMLGAQAPAERKLELRFHEDGNVTLIAQNVTIRDILAEWTRRGGSIVEGADRLPAIPQTLQYENEPEVKVLDSLLRSAPGIGLFPRLAGTTGASRIGRISIVAANRATTSYQMPTQTNVNTPLVSTPGSPADEIPPVNMQGPTPMSPNPMSPGPASPNAMPGATPAMNPNAPQPSPNAGRTGVPLVPVVSVPTVPTGPGSTGRGGGGGY